MGSLSLQLFGPPGSIPIPPFPIWFVIADSDNQQTDLICEYSFNGGGFQPATPAPTSDRLTALPAPNIGADYRFLWDALTDLGYEQSGSAVIRMTPVSGGVPGTAVATPAFSITTRSNALAPIFAAPTYVDPLPLPLSLIGIAPSGLAKGLSGMLFEEQFVVSGSMGGMRVSFTVVSDPGASDPLAEIDADASNLMTDTNSYRVVVGLRALPGARGTGKVQVRIVGVPDGTPSTLVEFPIQVDLPVLSLTYPLPSSATYGTESSAYFQLGPNPFQFDPRWPLVFNFSASGLVLSTTRLETSFGWGPAASGTIPFTPADFKGNGTLSVSCNNPDVAISPLSPITLTLPNAVQRMLDGSGTTESVYFILQRISGLAPDGNAPVVYPGLTVAQPLEVQFVDSDGTSYAATSVDRWPCGSPAPAPIPLTLFFHASGGTLSLSPAAGSSADLPVTCTLDVSGKSVGHPPVYFTPSGQGPWTVDVSTGGNLIDPKAAQIHAFDASGNPICNIFALQGGASCRFYFQPPTDVSLVDSTSGNPIPFLQVKPGTRARFQINGIADTVAGDPGKVTLDTVTLNGFQARGVGPFPAYVGGKGYGYVQYSGVTYGFQSSVTLTPRTTGPLVSADFLLTQGDAPEIAAPIPQCVHLLLPGSLFRIYQPDYCTIAYFPLACRKGRRRFSGPAEAIQESPVGTTPRGGGRETVSLRSGEFVYGACDLEYATRGDLVAFRRMYRSQLDNEGPLGPGWSFEHGQYFDASKLTWHDGSGQSYPFGWPDQTPLVPPKGIFHQMANTQTVTNDVSAWIITDPHQNAVHFNYDGSVKFLRDRKGNRTTYAYNEKAQLIRITDPLGNSHPTRCLTLKYWPDADPTSSALDKGRSGKLQSVGDFAGRIVKYDYDTQGRLTSVTYPPAPTITDGAADPNSNLHLDPSFVRSEGYTYDGNNQMLSVSRDGSASPLVTNQYDGQSRVFQQTFNGGQYSFSYPDPLTTQVIDRKQKTTKYTFPASPYPDGAAPTAFVDETGANQWKYVHNYDGNRVKVVEPTNKTTLYIYSDLAAHFATQPGGWAGSYEQVHGNLVAVRELATDGNERVWWYSYEPQYNFVSFVVEPEGNVPGANPYLAGCNYLYDYQVALLPPDPTLQSGNQGNLVQVTSPPSIHALVRPGASGVNQSTWLLDVQRRTRQYNSFGRCVWYQDPAGVVTRYAYYQESQPGSGASSADGGGFLAAETHDAEPSSLRNLYLPGVNVKPVSTQWTYDDLGRVQTATNPAGKQTKVETSPANEITSITIPTNAPVGSQPSSSKVQFAYSTFGLRRQKQLADGGRNVLSREEKTDTAGNVTDVFTAAVTGVFAHAQLQRDPNDSVIGSFPSDVFAAAGAPGAPPYPEAGGTMTPDDRGLPTAVNQGAPPTGTMAAPLLVTKFGWGAGDVVQSVQFPGADNPTTLLQDEFGVNDRLIDPKGNVTTVGYDECGRANRSIFQLGEGAANETARSDAPDFDAAPLLSSSEWRCDELGRVRRVHTARFVPGPGGVPLPMPADHIGQRQWTRRPPLPTARRRAACGVVKGALIVAGGFHQSPLSVVEALDLKKNTWATKSAVPVAVATQGAVVNGVLFLVGGTGAAGAVDAVQAYDAVADSWGPKANMLAPRSDHAVVACNGLIYAIGGTEAGGAVSTRCEAYDPAADRWTSLTALPTARSALAACVVNGKIAAIGGVAGGATLASVEWYDPIAGTWAAGSPLPGPIRCAAAAALGSSILVAGGFADPAVETPNVNAFAFAVPALGAAPGVWSPQAAMLMPQANTAFTADNGKLYVAGGASRGQDMAGVEVYNPLAAAWPPRAGALLPDGPLTPGDGRITQDFGYDIRGLPARVVDDRIGYTHVRRDGHGRPLQVDHWSAASPAILMSSVAGTYDDATGLLKEVRITERPTSGAIADPVNGTPAQSKTFRYKLDYDDLGRITRIVDGEGNASRVEYDYVGFMYVAYNAIGPDSTEHYDGAASSPLVNSDGNGTWFTPKGAYITDIVTPLVTLIDPSGLRATDPNLNSLNPSGAVGVHFTYTDDGRPLTFQGQTADPSGLRTTFRYDSRGRLQGVYHPPSAALPLTAPTPASPNGDQQPSLTIVQYDQARGTVELVSDANGSLLHFKHDDLRVTGITVDKLGAGVGGSTQLKFDYQGSTVTSTDVTTGRACQLTFDSTQKKLSEVQGAWTITHTDDGNGLHKLMYPGDAGVPVVIAYGFDTAGRLLYVTDKNSTLAEFEYLGARRVINRNLQGIKVTFTYSDGVGRLIAMRVDQLANQATIVYALQRDRLGRLLQRSRVMGGVTETKKWTYDSAGRIVIEEARPAMRTANVITTTRYFDGDTVLRMQTQAINGVKQTTIQTLREERGRIVQRNGLPLKYDRNGNLSTDDTGCIYTYDAFNRLIAIKSNAQTITYQYDALHRCVRKTSGATTEEYVYDNHELIQVRVNGAMVERLVYSDQLDDVLQLEVGGKTYFVLHGPEGWIEGLIDQLANVIELYDYSLTGEVTVLDGKGALKPAGTRPLSRLLFQKQPYDADARLYRYRNRWYDPRLGQFLTPNPLGHTDGPNLYVLNQANPVNLTSQFGLESVAAYATEIGVGIPQFARKQMDGFHGDIHSVWGKYDLAALAIGFESVVWTQNCNLPAWVAELYTDQVSRLEEVAAELNEEMIRRDGPQMWADTPEAQAQRKRRVEAMEEYERRHEAVLVAWEASWDLFTAACGLAVASMEPMRVPGEFESSEHAPPARRNRTGRQRRNPTRRGTGPLRTGEIGRRGEALVKALIRKLPGVKRVLALQNRSGHGMDIIVQFEDGTWEPIEVKTSITDKAPPTSVLQTDATEFLVDVLERVMDKGGVVMKHRGGIRTRWDAATVELAEEIRTDVVAGHMLRPGQIAEVTNLGKPDQKIEMRPWEREPGRGYVYRNE